MREPGPDVHCRKEEPNGELCEMFVQELLKDLQALMSSLVAPVPSEFRPRRLAEGSVFLVAEVDTSSGRELAGSLALIPLSPDSPAGSGLPEGRKVAELKRMTVRMPYRGRGVAAKLLTTVEDIARTELGLDMLVLETLHSLGGAQRLYESNGWKLRGVFGRYDARDSQCYEKWL